MTSILRVLDNMKRSAISIAASPRMAKAMTYNPDQKRKNYVIRLWDNIKWAIKFHELNRFYNLYDMDVAGRPCVNDPNYIDYLTFFRDRSAVNSINSLNDNHVVLLRDKHLMSVLFDYYHIPTAQNVAVIYDGVYYDLKGVETSVEKLVDLNKLDYFLKKVDGECADGVFHITSFQQLKDFHFLKGKYVLQKSLTQHPEMNRLWDGAINTCRICTLYDGKNVSVLSAVLRVGTEKSKPVDNWAHGGISVGVHDDGSLVEYGVYKPGYGGKAYEHPDTGVKFSDFIIPDYDQAVSLCKRAHLVMREVPAIGWDIALTVDGPVIIEGNDNWEISLMQASNHGLKKEWEQFMDDYHKNRKG